MENNLQVKMVKRCFGTALITKDDKPRVSLSLQEYLLEMKMPGVSVDACRTVAPQTGVSTIGSPPPWLLH